MPEFLLSLIPSFAHLPWKDINLSCHSAPCLHKHHHLLLPDGSCSLELAAGKVGSGVGPAVYFGLFCLLSAATEVKEVFKQAGQVFPDACSC